MTSYERIDKLTRGKRKILLGTLDDNTADGSSAKFAFSLEATSALIRDAKTCPLQLRAKLSLQLHHTSVKISISFRSPLSARLAHLAHPNSHSHSHPFHKSLILFACTPPDRDKPVARKRLRTNVAGLFSSESGRIMCA